MRPISLPSLVFIPPVSGLGQEQLLRARLVERLHPQGRNGAGKRRSLPSRSGVSEPQGWNVDRLSSDLVIAVNQVAAGRM